MSDETMNASYSALAAHRRFQEWQSLSEAQKSVRRAQAYPDIIPEDFKEGVQKAYDERRDQ